MFKLPVIYFALFCLLSQLIVNGQHNISYVWKPAHTGGGGYITGLAQHPANSRIIYARCDVGGIFKTTDGGANWIPCNNGLSKWYNHSVRSLVINSRKPEILFRCSGDKRNDTLFGAIHKTIDGGSSWREVCNTIGYYGNGPDRMFGEMIAIDNFNENMMLTAGNSKGIWISQDAGENWKYKTGADENFSTVAINPYFPDFYYAGTVSGKLYFSSDKGYTWKIIYRTKIKGFGFAEFVFDRKNPLLFYVACKFGGIYLSSDGGKNFTESMNGLPRNFQYNTITTDPHNSRILYTIPDARPNHSLAPVPLYKSINGGKDWTLIKEHTWENLSNYPAYVKEPFYAGWAVSKIRVDVLHSENILIANWYGVSFSNDGGINFTGKQFNGLETNCLENILFDPLNKSRSYYAVADHMAMKSIDGGKTYTTISKKKVAGSSSSVVLPSKYDSSFCLMATRSQGNAYIYRTEADTLRLLAQLEGAFIQSIKEDEFKKGTFYCYADGMMKGNAGVYKSTDWGEHWNKMNLDLPHYIKSLPHNILFIENELLNIVVGQQKNVCGTDKLLCVDPLQNGCIYFGEWTEGIFKSSDGGDHWMNITGNLPFHKDTASVLTVIKADPNRKGWIYAGFVREGLWLTENGGNTWKKIYPSNMSNLNVNDIHIGGVTGNEIYIAGESLYWSEIPSTVLFSPDNGSTWQNIYDKALGALRIKAIDVNRQNGNIVLATSGNGAFFAERKN